MDRPRLALAVALVLMAASCGPATLAAQLGRYGYDRLVPPRGNYDPGFVVVLNHTSAGYNPQLLCPASRAFKKPPKVSTEPSADLKLKKALAQKLTLSANLQKQAKAGISANHKVNVDLRLTNVKVEDVADMDLLPDGLTTACRKDIKDNLEKGRRVFALSQILVADVSYDVTVSDSDSLSASAKGKLLKQVAANLDLKNVSTSGLEITGTGLAWGAQPGREYRLSSPNGLVRPGAHPRIGPGPTTLTTSSVSLADAKMLSGVLDLSKEARP